MVWLWARLSDIAVNTPGHIYEPFWVHGFEHCFQNGLWGDDVPLDTLIQHGLNYQRFAGVIFAWPSLYDPPFQTRTSVFNEEIPIEIYGPNVLDSVGVERGLYSAIASRTTLLRRHGRESILYCGMPLPTTIGNGISSWVQPLKAMNWPGVWLDSAGEIATAQTWYKYLRDVNPVYERPGNYGVEPIPRIHGALAATVAGTHTVIQAGVKSGPMPWPYTPFAPGDARVRVHGTGWYGITGTQTWHRTVLLFSPSGLDLANDWSRNSQPPVDVAIWPQTLQAWTTLLAP